MRNLFILALLAATSMSPAMAQDADAGAQQETRSRGDIVRERFGQMGNRRMREDNDGGGEQRRAERAPQMVQPQMAAPMRQAPPQQADGGRRDWGGGNRDAGNRQSANADWENRRRMERDQGHDGWRGPRGDNRGSGNGVGNNDGGLRAVPPPVARTESPVGQNLRGQWERGREDQRARDWDRSRDDNRVRNERGDGQRGGGQVGRDHAWGGTRNDGHRGNNGANRGWNDGRRYGQNDGNQSWTRGWNRSWRDNNRYDWSSHRNQYGSYYRQPRYFDPYGSRFGYRSFGIGIYLDSLFYGSRYWINDPYSYRLPDAPYGYRWVRYYDDVLLVDLRSGYVVDKIRDFFW
jgi:hypothetical protein